MKKVILFLLLTCLAGITVQAQCYNRNRSMGIELYNAQDYAKAKKCFVNAKQCPDKPYSDDLNAWIRKCDDKLNPAREEEEVFLVVEDDPEFPGGCEALYKFIGDNQHYHRQAKENNITGRVFVSFVVEKDGSVSNAQVLRDIGGGCGAEAVRLVKSMPKWKPGKQHGKPVRTQFNLPVLFDI